MIELLEFTNKSGKKIPYLSIPNGKYNIRVGIKKTKAVLENALEISSLLKEKNL